jgi:hypothetical protein
VLEDGGDASLKEGKIHQANATEVRLRFAISNDLAECTNNLLRTGSKGHDGLVLNGDGEIVQSKTCQVTSVSTFLGQALSKRSEDIVFSAADHGDAVLLVAYITQFVDALGGGGALFSLGVEHGFDKCRNIIKSRWLGRSALWGSLLLVLGSGLLGLGSLGVFLRGLGLLFFLLLTSERNPVDN